MNCAQDGHALGIVFAVMRDMEKEVVLLDPSPSTTRVVGDAMHADASIGYTAGSHAERMAVDTPAPAVQSRVLKIIKKLEVQILCTQHNPVCLFPSRFLNVYQFLYYDTSLLSHIHTYDCHSVSLGCGCSEKSEQARQDSKRAASTAQHGKDQDPCQRWCV